MTPERLQEILDGFKADRESVHQEFCIPSDHCTCHESADKECAEIQAEIDRLTRELAEVYALRQKTVVEMVELEAENARLREALERITQIVPEEQTSPLTALTFAFKLAEVVLQAAKEKP